MAWRSKTWVFTLNNPEWTWEELPEGVTYMIWQTEKVTTPHFQGYLELDRRRALRWLKAKISSRAHWEPRKGNQAQAIAYCRKADSRIDGPWELGQKMMQGARTDLYEMMKIIEEGGSQGDLQEQVTETHARYSRYSQEVMNRRRPKRKPRKVVLFKGSTGTGKTRRVWDAYEGTQWYEVPVSNTDPWFDGYDGEPYVLIDEFAGRGSKWGLTMLLKILHEYPVKVPIKHGFVWWNPEVITITSNSWPWQWYDYTTRPEQLKALERRINVVLEFKADGPPQDVTASDCWKEPKATSESTNLVPEWRTTGWHSEDGAGHA